MHSKDSSYFIFVPVMLFTQDCRVAIHVKRTCHISEKQIIPLSIKAFFQVSCYPGSLGAVWKDGSFVSQSNLKWSQHLYKFMFQLHIVNSTICISVLTLTLHVVSYRHLENTCKSWRRSWSKRPSVSTEWLQPYLKNSTTNWPQDRRGDRNITITGINKDFFLPPCAIYTQKKFFKLSGYNWKISGEKLY